MPAATPSALSGGAAAGRDLTVFFTAWGLTTTDGTRAQAASLGLPAPDQDPTTRGP